MALQLERIDTAAAEPNVTRMIVYLTDGTVPGQIEVLMETTNFVPLTNSVDDWQEWVRGRLADMVRDTPEVDQLAALRSLSPVRLHYG